MNRTNLIVLLLACLAGGCHSAQIGPSFDTRPDGTFSSRNADGPNRVSLFKDGEAWNTESTIPSTYLRFMASDHASVEALGPKARVLEVPLPGGGFAKAASDTDATFSVAKATLPDGTVIEGLSITTAASPVIRAQNEALDRLKDVLTNRDAKSAEKLLADDEAIKSIVGTLGPGILDVLKTLAGK